MGPMIKRRFMSRTPEQKREYARRLASAVKLISGRKSQMKVGTVAALTGVSVGDIARVGRRKGLYIPLKRTGFRRKRV